MSSCQASVNYYSVLGVSRDASLKEINLAFKALALKLHPDKSGGDQASIDQFCLTQEAVETLRDPELRRRHDESLSGASFNLKHKEKGHHRYKGPRGPANKYEHGEWNDGRARNPLQPQYTSRDTPNRHGSGERDKESEWKSPEQQYKCQFNMWGPFIHAYNVHSPRPILKAPMTIRQLDPTGEGEGESKPQPAAIEPETQNAPAKSPQDEPKTPIMHDQQAEEIAKKDVADGLDTPSDELLDSNGNSIYHDSTDYESMGESCPDYHLSGHVHSWAASGYDDSSESGGVSLPSDFGEDQDGEDDTMHTMYYDCSENLEHDPTEGPSSSTDEEISEEKTKENTNEETNENTVHETGNPREVSGLWPTLRPFVPYFDDKLQNSQGRYTTDDMLGEMRGLFLEPYRGWLEAARLAIPGEKESDNSSDPAVCEHRGLWAKTYGCSECRLCGLYRPLYTLICPACGKQACIRCKFDEGPAGE